MTIDTVEEKPSSSIPLVDIKNAYGSEYFSGAAKTRKGFLGTFNRFLTRMSPYKDEPGPKLTYAAMLVGLPLMILPHALLGYALLATLASCVTAGVAHLAVRRDANKAIKSDVANGTLVDRYTAAQALAKQQRIEFLQSELSALRGVQAKPGFDAAAPPVPPGTVTQLIDRAKPPVPSSSNP